MLTKEAKQKSIQSVRAHDSDTGSSAAQIAVLTNRIHLLDTHLKGNRKDNHSRRGLVGLVERRRKHLSYLKRKNLKLYEQTVEALGLRK